MPHEPSGNGHGRLLAGLFAFMVTLVVGGTATFFLVDGFKARVDQSARRDALVIGNSVARTLAQQFERAARFNVPLKLIPGVDAYLSETLADTPGLSQIILRGPDGREIRSAIGENPGTDSTNAPVLVDGLKVASVEVSTNPSALSASFNQIRTVAVIAVIACAVLSGLAGAFLVGAGLNAQRALLAESLARAATDDFEPTSSELRRASQMRSGAVGRAFSALMQGNRRLLERRAAFDAYAEELLAVDFDGTLRPDVERVRLEVNAPTAAPEKGRGL